MSFRDRFNSLSTEGKGRLLDRLGLEPKSTATDMLLPALGIFGAGLIAGAIVGLMVAPKPGPELRSELREGASNLGHRLQESTQGVRQRLHIGAGSQETETMQS